MGDVCFRRAEQAHEIQPRGEEGGEGAEQAEEEAAAGAHQGGVHHLLQDGDGRSHARPPHPGHAGHPAL